MSDALDARDDSQLYRSWCQGDAAAGSRLFARHAPAVLRFFANKASADWEDLVQQTFLRCVESQGRFRGDSRFRTFLFGVARNVLLNYYRRRAGSGREVTFEQSRVAELVDSPSSVVARDRQQRAFLEALRALSLDDQTLLELYHWEDLTASQLGEVFECPEGTIRTRLAAAKKRLALAFQRGSEPAERSSGPVDLEHWAREVRARVAGDLQLSKS